MRSSRRRTTSGSRRSRCAALDGDTLVLEAPEDRRRWVADRFARVLQTCAAVVIGPGRHGRRRRRAGRRRARTPARRRSTTHGRPELNPKLTFDQFVIGDANRLAHAAALAVAELPGTAYNPLFIYGPPGVGKTHLLQSIAQLPRRLRARACASGTRRRSGSPTSSSPRIQTRDVDRFKGAWRDNDVLLIDDVQFLERKAKTEEEFFHTFNALHDAGAQLVLTSDSPPRDLDALEDRLRERFESGLVTDIASPCHADARGDPAQARAPRRPRRPRRRASSTRSPAGCSTTSARSRARSSASSPTPRSPAAPLTRRPGRRGPREPLPLPPRAPGTRAHGADHRADPGRGLRRTSPSTRDELLSGSRTARIAWPRQVAMYLAREHTQASLPAIGAAFGGRNHTTVMHAVKRTEQRMSADRDAYDAIQAVTARLRADGRD